MKSSTFSFLFIALAQARFNQENIPIDAIRQVQGGDPGVADTIAGAAISDLLAGANACAKLQRGDRILSELGDGEDAVAAAIGMVAAEKNFNPFAQDQPTICDDATLPQNALLRGITPKIDPAVRGANVANALSAQTASTPLSTDGKSIADLLSENGFTNFLTQGLTGGSTAAGSVKGSSNTTVNNSSNSTDTATVDSQNSTSSDNSCNSNIGTTIVTMTVTTTVGAAGTASVTASNTASTTTGASNSGADFGSCNPTMSFEAGRPGRKATEFTFQSNDPVIAANQQDALNPNIITNRICDELVNICAANDAAIAQCKDAKAQILALGTKDQSTADAWNALIGTGAQRRRLRRMARS